MDRFQHRGLPFARVQAALVQRHAELLGPNLGDRHQRAQVGQGPDLDSLDRPKLLDRLGQRPEVASMGGQQDHAPEAAPGQRPDQVGHDGVKGLPGDRQRAWELQERHSSSRP